MCKKGRDETRLKSSLVAEVASTFKQVNHEDRDQEREREISSLSLCGNLSLKSACCDVPTAPYAAESVLDNTSSNAMDGAANGAACTACSRVVSPADSDSSSPPTPSLSPSARDLASSVSYPEEHEKSDANLLVPVTSEVKSGAAPESSLSSSLSRFYETAKERCFYQEIPQKKAGFKTIFMEGKSSKTEKITSDPTNVMVRHFYDLGRFALSCSNDRDLEDREEPKREPFSPYSSTVSRRVKQSKGKERVRDEEELEEEVAAKKRRAIDLECDA